MSKKPMKALSLVVLAAMGLELASCGTILYPDRRGRRGGHIDSGVVIMDGLWCLVFLVPGVVGFIVDFSTGAIYE